MAKRVILRPRDIRKEANQFRVSNFADAGWLVRNIENTGWYRMVPENTRIRNPEHDEAVHAPDDPEFPLWLEPFEPDDSP